MAKFPRIEALGLTIILTPAAHVRREELHAALGDKRELFGKLFGIQTCLTEGPYAWDVESVLERMESGKLTGSQKDFD